MTEALTLADARKAIGQPDDDTSVNADLLDTWIPATTKVVEDVTGPLVRRTGLTYTADGSSASVMLPSAVSSVTSVVEDGTTLAEGGYTVDLANGIIYRGPAEAPFDFRGGRGAVVVTYVAGTITTDNQVPPHVRLAARMILRSMWQPEENGDRDTFGQPDMEMTTTPSGHTIPKRAYELLSGGDDDVAGFA